MCVLYGFLSLCHYQILVMATHRTKWSDHQCIGLCIVTYYKITNCFPSNKYNLCCHIIQEYAYNLFVSMRVPLVKHKDVILCYRNILYGRWSDDLDLDTLWLSRQKQKHEQLESQLLACWMLGPALCHYHTTTSLQVLHRLWRLGSFN